MSDFEILSLVIGYYRYCADCGSSRDEHKTAAGEPTSFAAVVNSKLEVDTP